MLELKAAPSQNPVLPAANAANAANAPATAGEGADAASLPQPGMSFAALLKQHVGLAHGLDKKAAAAAVDALLPAQAKEALQEAEAATDPIALLAPMLAGIAVPQAGNADVAETGAVADGLQAPAADAAAVVTAAPVAAAATTATTTAANGTSAQSGSEASSGKIVDNLPREGEKAQPGAANIAARPAAEDRKSETGAERSAAGQQQNFDAALNTAKEALAHAQAPVRSPQAATPAAASAPVATPVGAPGWGGEVGDKVVWMVGRQETRAELVLNPPQMGRIEVSLTMNGDQANATFISANATVREALENAMPRLREVLQGAGISLGQTQVGAESFQQAAQQQQTGDNQGRGHGRGNADDAPQGLALGHEHAPGQLLKRGAGLVDTFA